ncbi:MAG: tRNA 2-thiouridine(34) synthase MnmA [Syntrophales bacterium]|nr:tRNA 2-thiouridine(34) synthase MnmA [Syntrophales bacterium]
MHQRFDAGKIRETAMKKTVLAAMSGGVDSSVAACLLVEAGYDVTGITMRLDSTGEDHRDRHGRNALEDARTVCAILGIDHHVVDFRDSLRREVIDRFVRQYRGGRTPNPCIDCNRLLKFGRLLDTARSMGFDYLATGHYARIEETGNGLRLMRARDRVKDQSYFLYVIGTENMSRILFPLGNMTKEEVRAVADRAALPVTGGRESQDICFVEGKDYRSFLLKEGVEEDPGPIVDVAGRLRGTHRGIAFYTIGQRRGLGIAAKEPLYVVSIDAEHNKLVVGSGKDLRSSVLNAGDFITLVDVLPGRAQAKIRYRKQASPCTVTKVAPGRVRLEFSEPQTSVAPGQAVVLYQGDLVLGGGVIEKAPDDRNCRPGENVK